MKTARLILAVVLPVNLAFALWHYGRPQVNGDRTLTKFHTVVTTVRKHYVDDTDETIGYDNLINGALSGMLQKLDKHSHYLDPTAYKSAQESMKGEFAGIGIIFSKKEKNFLINQVLPGGPAARAGLKADDQIAFVDGEDIRGKTMSEASKLLKGEEESDVILGIIRPSEQKGLDITVTRQLIKLPTIRNIHLLENGILYIQLTQFNRKTARDLEVALFKQSAHMKGLILDVRNNPGGLLLSAGEICSFFLPAWKNGKRCKVVTTIPRKKENEAIHFVQESDPKYLTIPIAVLVNGNSASAAEILAGCIKDYARGVLIGTKTYGKGSVQQEINLGDGSAMRLTTAKYYTPSNAVIHGNGIKPDIEIKLTAAQDVKVQRKLTAIVPEEHNNLPDPQLQKAIEVLNKRLSGDPQ